MHKLMPKIYLLLFVTSALLAQVNQNTIIIYQNENLRDLAREHFNDPDLWTTILKFNRLNSAAELKAGMELQLPVQLVLKTRQKLADTKNVINDAARNGARIFTPDLLDSAITFFDLATTQAKNEEWERAFNSADISNRLALEALETSQLLRNQSADATISYKKGTVQSRRPTQRVWEDAYLFKKLYEKDRARTLSDSYAEITFIDLNRVRLNENSQAVIQQSKIDLLKSKTDSKVKLTRGEAFAYLAQSPKRKFDIDITGIETIIRSKNFWIKKEETSTMIANYDGKIEFKSEDSVVVLEENQGSTIQVSGLPSQPRNLLPAPSLISPSDQFRSYSNNITFTWKKVKGAVKYWFEISDQPSFHTVDYSFKNLESEEITISNLSPGLYFWHVSSIDENGFPGRFNEYYILELLVDNSKPFLRIDSPANQLVTKSADIDVSGETEPDVRLFINNLEHALQGDGKFNTTFVLSEGYNMISFRALDIAGNESLYERAVIYESNPDVQFSIKNSNAANNKIIFNSNRIKLEAFTRALSSVDLHLLTSGKKLRAFADTSGYYNFNFTIDTEKEYAVQQITTPAGYTLLDTLEFEVDKSVPKIQFEDSVPKYTSLDSINLAGTVTGADNLQINGKNIDLQDGRFIYNYTLVPGNNPIEFVSIAKSGLPANISLEVYCDQTPPELLEQRIVRSSAGKDLFTVKIGARDDFGLKKSCIVNLNVQGEVRNLVLVLDKNQTFYERNVKYYGKRISDIKIESVELEDYLGNKKNYNLN